MSKASETQVVSNGETEATGRQNGLFERSGWCRWDAVALSVWTAALAVFFWDALSLRRALFYFDITEINYPYRAFFAEELRPGDSRAGARGFIVAYPYLARARQATSIRSSICSTPGCRPGKPSTSTPCCRFG